MAERGDPLAYKISRPMMKGGFDFSFSGLKTRVADLYRACGMDGLPDGAKDLCDLAASFQAAVDVMAAKLASAISSNGVAGGGWRRGGTANGALRRAASEASAGLGVPLYVPKPSWHADNAAMIGFLGSLQLERGINPLGQSAEAKTRWNVECPAKRGESPGRPAKARRPESPRCPSGCQGPQGPAPQAGARRRQGPGPELF
jgi:N6-L-threonylcarbamoyladenine synthase